MKSIIVASTNPVKIQAALTGFQKMFPEQEFQIRGVRVPSGVQDQPMSDDETLRGAVSRVHAAEKDAPNADFWVGIEGGVAEMQGKLAGFAWVVVKKTNLVGQGRTATFFLPDRVTELIHQGYELGHADDIVFNRSNSKQENGAVGILTGDVLDRMRLYEMAVILALIPFKNSQLYVPDSTGV